MSAPFVPTVFPAVTLERSADNLAAVAVAQGLAMQRLQQRLANARHWLRTLPDEAISEAARRDGLYVLAGEPEPGR